MNFFVQRTVSIFLFIIIFSVIRDSSCNEPLLSSLSRDPYFLFRCNQGYDDSSLHHREDTALDRVGAAKSAEEINHHPAIMTVMEQHRFCCLCSSDAHSAKPVALVSGVSCCSLGLRQPSERADNYDMQITVRGSR